MERWGRGLLASCSLIYLCLVGAGHGRPAAWEAAGACTPKLSYSMGNVTCYGPAQVAQAERRLLQPPLRPVAAVWRVAHLPLDQVDAMQPISPTQRYGNASGPVVSLDYLFGPPTPAALYSIDPPPSHPAFVVVHEAIGSIADIGDVQLDRGSYSGSGGSGYDAWDLTANIPGRPLYLHITSNQGAATLIRIAAEVVGRTIRCGAVSGGPVQTRRCTYAATPITAVNGPLLVTVARPNAHDNVLLAVRPGLPPRVLISGLPQDAGIAASPRGRYIALAEGARGLWLVNADGTHLYRRLLPPPPTQHVYPLVITAVAWSPDRYTLAYVVDEDRSSGTGYTGYAAEPHVGVWVARYDGGPARQIVASARFDYTLLGVSWASDVRHIAIDTNGSVVTIDVATNQVGASVDGLGAYSPVAPQLVYTTNQGGSCGPTSREGSIPFCLIDAQGRHQRVVGHDATRPGDCCPYTVVWSPDGQNVAYILFVGTTQRVEIHTLNILTGRVQVSLLPSQYALVKGGAGLAWLQVQV